MFLNVKAGSLVAVVSTTFLATGSTNVIEVPNPGRLRICKLPWESFDKLTHPTRTCAVLTSRISAATGLGEHRHRHTVVIVSHDDPDAALTAPGANLAMAAAARRGPVTA